MTGAAATGPTGLARVAGQTPALPGAVRAGDLVYTSGIVAPSILEVMAAGGTATAAPVFADQARDALDTLLRILDEAGADASSVLRIECFLDSAARFDEWNTAYASVWPVPGPARTTLVAGFVHPAVVIEIQAVASVR